MTDRANDEGGNQLGKHRKRAWKSRLELLEEWLQENVRYYDVKEKVTLFGFDVSFSWDKDTCGYFHVKFDDEACPDPFEIFYAMNGKPDFRTPISHSPAGVPGSYATVEFSHAVHKALLAGLSTALPKAKPFGLDSETGGMVNVGTPLGRRFSSWPEVQAAEEKLSAPFFFLEIPIETSDE